MRSVKFNNDVIQLKSAWNELTRSEILLLAKATINGMGFFHTAFLLFLKMSGLRMKSMWRASISNRDCYALKRSRQIVYKVTAEDMTFVLRHRLTWPFRFETDENTGQEKIYVKSLLTKNLLPAFRHRLRRYVGPEDALLNVSYNEWLFAETNYIRFLKSGNEHYLHLLVAVLYRPRVSRLTVFTQNVNHSFGGDFRTRFNPYYIEKRARRLSNMAGSISLVILWFYQGSRILLHRKFPHLFQQGEGSDDADIFESFMDLSNAATGGDPARLEKIKTQNLWEVLKKLDTDVKSAERLKRKNNG